jgi:hypothetical protein
VVTNALCPEQSIFACVVGVDEVVGVVVGPTLVVEPADEGLLLLPHAATPTAMSVAAARLANLRTVILLPRMSRPYPRDPLTRRRP